jgi:hypothetical protein
MTDKVGNSLMKFATAFWHNGGIAGFMDGLLLPASVRTRSCSGECNHVCVGCRGHCHVGRQLCLHHWLWRQKNGDKDSKLMVAKKSILQACCGHADKDTFETPVVYLDMDVDGGLQTHWDKSSDDG